VERKRFSGSIKAGLIEWFLVFTASLSYTVCISTFLNIPLNIRYAAAVLGTWSFVFLPVRGKRSRVLIFVPAALLLWGCYVWKNWEIIVEEKNLSVIMVLAVIILAVGIYAYKTSLVQVVMTVFLIAVFLLTDRYSDSTAVFLWLAALFAMLVCGRENAGFRCIAVMAVTFALFAGIHRYISAPAAQMVHEHDDKARAFQYRLNSAAYNAVRRLSVKKGINGRLDNDNPGDNTTVDLIVSVSEQPEKNIYLRGFVGEDYLGDEWSELSDAQFQKEVESWNTSELDYRTVQMKLLNAYYTKCETDDADLTEPLSIVLQNESYSDSYALLPYGAFVRLPNDLLADGMMAQENYTQYRYSYYPVTEYGTDNYAAMFDPLLNRYSDYVREHYLDGWEQLENLQVMAKQLDGTTFDTVKESIRNLLTSNCVYSKELDPLPYGVDFTEYFLMDQKKGYCIHFATASTLLFRIMGYPARYATGYVVQPQDFVKNADGGYSASVTGNSAHAWTEVYLDGIWYPVETTPGYISTAPEYDIDAEHEERQEQLQEEQQEEEAEEDGQEALNIEEDEEDEDGEDADSTQSFAVHRENPDIRHMLYGIFGVLAVCVGALVLRRKIVTLYYRNCFSKCKPDKAVLRMTELTIRMLEHAGYPKKNMSDTEYTAYVQIDEFETMLWLARSAKFSTHPASSEDVQKCIYIKNHIEETLYERRSRVQRFVWKYVYCYR
jgi:hypothetical protein